MASAYGAKVHCHYGANVLSFASALVDPRAVEGPQSAQRRPSCPEPVCPVLVDEQILLASGRDRRLSATPFKVLPGLSEMKLPRSCARDDSGRIGDDRAPGSALLSISAAAAAGLAPS